MAPVDVRLDQLLGFSWIRIKTRVHTTGAGARRGRVPLAMEAISCPYCGRVRTFTFPSHLGPRMSIEASCSYWIGRSRSGVCAGAVAGQSIFDTAVSNRSATRPTNPADLPISVQTEAVKSQSFSAEPKTAAVTEPNSTISEQPEPVKSPVEPTHVTSPDNPVANEAQISTLGQSTSNQPPCDVSLCERYYRSFRASDCTYQPYG